jgi:hypothetical protein
MFDHVVVKIRGTRINEVELSVLSRLAKGTGIDADDPNERSFQTENKASREELEPILADDFTIIRSTGVIEDKQRMLDRVASVRANPRDRGGKRQRLRGQRRRDQPHRPARAGW